VDILLTNNDNAVGFRQEKDGTFTAIGDFYGLRSKDGKALSADVLGCEVLGKSKEEEISDRLGALGFVRDAANCSETSQKIRMTLERWV